MNYVEHEVIRFKRYNRLHKCNYKNLLKVCHRNDCIVMNYTKGYNFMCALGIWKKAQGVPSISIVDSSGNKLIFIKDNLSPEKRLFALAHEMGHIHLKHKPDDEQAENEANEFAHLLLDSWHYKPLDFSIPVIILLLCVTISLILSNIFTYINDKAVVEQIAEPITDSSVCYYTKYGEVYHLYSDCYYLKNSKIVYSGTVKDCNKDRSCSYCEKRLNNE